MKKNELPFQSGTMTVMIIDDHDPIRKAIRRILSGMGFGNILESPDGHDALKTLAKTPVDLIITDIYMRQVTGFDLLKKIRSQNFGADIPIIVVTGEASKDDIIKTADLGADGYILKPFQITDIEKKVTSVLMKYHSPSERLKILREADRLSIMEKHADALKLFEAAERLDPKSLQAKFGKALMMEKLGQTGEAIKILRASSEESPTFYKNFAALADIFLTLEQTEAAIQALKNELELNPKQPDRQILLADLLTTEGDALGAIEHYRLALLENPKDKNALLKMGSAYDLAGNPEKAIYYYRRARRHHGGLTRALKMLIDLHERSGNPKAAIYEMIDEIRVNPARYDARVLLADLHLKADDTEAALKVVDEGLIREPTCVPLLKSKAAIYSKANESQKACEIYKQVVEINPTEGHHMLYGESLLSERQFTEAYQAFFAALENAQQRSHVLARIAETLKRMGYSAQAVTVLQLMTAETGAKAAAEEIKTLMPGILNRRRGAAVKKTG